MLQPFLMQILSKKIFKEAAASNVGEFRSHIETNSYHKVLHATQHAKQKEMRAFLLTCKKVPYQDIPGILLMKFLPGNYSYVHRAPIK